MCAAGCTTDLLANTECDTACDNKNCNFDNQVCNASSDCPLGQYLDGTDCIDCSYPCS